MTMMNCCCTLLNNSVVVSISVYGCRIIRLNSITQIARNIKNNEFISLNTNTPVNADIIVY